MNQQMFGCDPDEFVKSVIESLTYKAIAPSRGSSAALAAMSTLSDAQEEIAHGMNEEARQTINCAKLLLQKIVDQ